MSGNWRCLIGWHDWREVETADRDHYAECNRCSNRDWRRLLRRVASEYRPVGFPPGAEFGVEQRWDALI